VRRTVRFFVSYARANAKHADALLGLLQQQLAPSIRYEHALWRDTCVVIGENWDREIRRALDESEVGLLLVSPAFLASKYITDIELPELLARPVLPVLLEQVSHARHDLHGLQEKQLYALTVGEQRRAFVDCSGKDKRGFASGLFAQMEARLDKLFNATRGAK
jgi:hypothetical protein